VLVSDVGTWRKDFTLEDPWWIDTLADSHAAVFLNNFWKQGTGSYNGTGTDSKVAVARLLKKRNPKLKVLFYQAADRVGDTEYVMNTLMAHPDWWLRDDNGNLIPFGQKVPYPGSPEGRPQIDPTVVAAQDWYSTLSVKLFHNHSECIELLDGIMVDGSSWSGASRYGPNVSEARYAKIFAGKMEMLAKTQAVYTNLKPAGGVLAGNPLMEYGQIGPSPPPPGSSTQGGNWNTTLYDYAGAFDEMFGAFGTMLTTGGWDPLKMKVSFEAIINASSEGKTIMIHAFPGPAGTTAGTEGMFPTRGNTSTGNTFHVAQWAGQERVPEDAHACRQASADRLVESLAPFLIVANEHVFFGYGWFYNLEDGYIPCKEGVECGMPNQWFPEYTRPLGAPLGSAKQDVTGMKWTREFAHASVSVDLTNRSASKIEWHAVGTEYPAFTSQSRYGTRTRTNEGDGAVEDQGGKEEVDWHATLAAHRETGTVV
jgi:hypothetical protein